MRTACRIVGFTIVFLLLAAPASAAVGVSVDVLWRPNPEDDMQIALHASNIAYPMPRERVVPVFQEIGDPYADYPVLAFIAYNARVDIGTVWSYRQRSGSWVDVMFHFGVRPDALFVNLSQPPGPPYGRAYGYWRKHRNAMGRSYLSDDDVRFWINVRTMSRYAGVAPARVYGWNHDGRRFEQIAGNQYREKHGDHRGRSDEGDNSQGRGKGRGKHKG